MTVYCMPSYLSNDVKKLLCHPYEFCLNGITSSSVIIDLEELNDILQIDDIGNTNYFTIMLTLSERISSNIQSLETLSRSDLETIMHGSHGTIITNSELWQYINNVLHADFCCNFVNLQKLTADLEHALGNILLNRNAPSCPNMLKDILSCDLLVELIPNSLINFMQILFGPNTSLNLRNLAWHGYLSADELNPFLVKMLILCIVNCENSIGRGVDLNRNIRAKISLSPYQNHLTKYFPEILSNEILLNELFHLFNIHPISKHGSVAFNSYEYLKKLLNSRRTLDSVLFIFPLMEQLLRCEFCVANSLPSHWLTARHNVFFITLDDMLSRTVSLKGPAPILNRFITVMPESILTVMHDLFIYPNGPRLRDRISHGEIDKDSVNHAVLNAVLGVFTSILLLHPSSLPDQSEISNLKNRLMSEFDSYESQFHPIAILRQSTVNLLQFCVQYIQEIDHKTIACSFYLSEGIFSTTRSRDMEMREYFVTTMKHSLSQCVKVLYRGQEIVSETDKTLSNLVTLLQLIVTGLQRYIHQIISIYKEREHLVRNRQLRSRQRENFEKLQNCLFASLDFCLEIIVLMNDSLDVFVRNNSSSDLPARILTKKQWKLLTQLHQTIDKMESLSGKSKWDEIIAAIRVIESNFTSSEE